MKNHIGVILIALIAISYVATRPYEAEAGTLLPCGEEGHFCCLFGDKCDEGLACINFICNPIPESCDGFSGTTGTLCNAYCEKLECESEIPLNQILRRLLCNFIEKSFMAKTGIEPPCEVDPCAELASVAECPCDYFQVPMTTACWGDCTGCNGQPIPFEPCRDPNCIPGAGFNADDCELNANHPTIGIGINAENAAVFADLRCLIAGFDKIDSCGAAPQSVHDLSEDQFATCLCRLAQYTNELHQAGIDVSDSGPPFSCEPPPP
jgi:hypothetical protein